MYPVTRMTSNRTRTMTTTTMGRVNREAVRFSDAVSDIYLPPSLTRLLSLCHPTVEVGFRQNILTYLLGLVALTIFLTVAALVFKIWEREWTFLDAFYFSFVTMTTVGFGDMVPSESSIYSA